jgi:hypothetical protein
VSLINEIKKMRRTLFKYLIFSIFLVAICSLSGGAIATETQSITGLLAAGDQPAYAVPEGKQQKWQSLQTLVQKEYNECVEDCGNDDACLKRCEDVHKVRLDREYKKLMSE